MSKPFFVFGNCAASQLAMGIEILRLSNLDFGLPTTGYWAMAADNFLNNAHYEKNNEKLVLKRPLSGVEADRPLFKSGIETSMDAWMYLPNYIELPLLKDVYYVFASPIFPYSPFVSLIRNFNRYHPSTSMINNVIRHSLKPLFDFLKSLAPLVKNILIVEGPRLFKINNIDIYIYQMITEKYINYSKNYLTELGIDFLELPVLDVLDDNGFMKDVFRLNKDDYLHANRDYGLLMAKHVLKKTGYNL